MPLSPKTMQIQSILSQVKEKARKALFSAFDTVWAGVSHDKISALKNV
jgi:hypothetical protein